MEHVRPGVLDGGQELEFADCLPVPERTSTRAAENPYAVWEAATPALHPPSSARRGRQGPPRCGAEGLPVGRAHFLDASQMGYFLVNLSLRMPDSRGKPGARVPEGRIEALGTPPGPGNASVHADIERVLIDEPEIRLAIERMARALTQTYEGRDLTVVSVLKGSCIFASDLIRRMPIPLELAFVAASSYGNRTTSASLDLSCFPKASEITGRELLLVDDILDTGQTLHRLQHELLIRGAGAVKTCVFLDKPARRRIEFEADFRCFEIEDHFVVGYGLDYAGRYRNLPYVGALKPAIYQNESSPAPALPEGGRRGQGLPS